MLGQYLPLFALFALAALFAAGSFVASGLLAPRRATVPKLDPYECGIVPSRDTPERFPVRFFLVAMIFIVFDVEIVLFYPYAVARGGLGLFGLVVLLVFSFAVFESFVYLIGAGALEWGPVSKSRRSAGPAEETGPDEEIVSAARTARTTVRRVGLEGRVPSASEVV
ncbi:MAG: NADH-quinone oxidoreductase subunit A [Acidimicrobiaceae bacterium]|nr:NADH-quinone oxidoreductase subunit A [Acidimicrobiaceae bacterium]MYE97794.1 NADH-quinone oxidoreductase subunit A [Acidimicrobiaceae bacterium]MYH44859.1 NADH-quinone oxidoreductase subunit A [Acidimicrobiaceae bacterium]MYI52695.1 NADH-quinone oxidoreductase subunit A [Acidimicrobiaceae bacterium]MYJ40850.1 NADH-quinone oxidoreductase subunit A [Acidimicrobiaceae bacterium]